MVGDALTYPYPLERTRNDCKKEKDSGLINASDEKLDETNLFSVYGINSTWFILCFHHLLKFNESMKMSAANQSN